MRHAFLLLLPLAVFSTLYIYLYPLLRPDQCSFPTPPLSANTSSPLAPFRLLALADPQLEGSSNLPTRRPRSAWTAFTTCLPTLPPSALPAAASTLVLESLTTDLPLLLATLRKQLDLRGNDAYLAHVFATTRRWTAPTHVVALGDLLGSQWVDAAEFGRRAGRFWGIFAGMGRAGEGAGWAEELICVAGNHDVGYAGDLDTHRLERFEARFGRVNWAVDFALRAGALVETDEAEGEAGEAPPRLGVVVLNSMNLDSPAYNKEHQRESWAFVDAQARRAAGRRDGKDALVLLTHIPLHKPEGVCVDGPLFSHFPEENGAGVSEQNHLSEETSVRLLDGLFAGEWGTRAGVVLNGHDHEGCHTVHARRDTGAWSVARLEGSRAVATDELREVTVRSMMGSFGGNAGLVSAWFDEGQGRWVFEYRACMFGVQHIWWAVHALDAVVLALGLCLVPAWFLQDWNGVRMPKRHDFGKSDKRKNE